MSEKIESAREFADRLFNSPTLEQDVKLIEARDIAVRSAAWDDWNMDDLISVKLALETLCKFMSKL